MAQTRMGSVLETCASIAVGFCVSVAITAVVMPMYGHQLEMADNVQITAIFTVASIVRGYLVRRAFVRWGHG